MARSSGSATISFGLINIPVKQYITASPDRLSFNMISPAGNRVQQALLDKETKEPVERKDTKSGYEYSKGQYIVFDDSELESLEGPKSNMIEIQEIVSDINLSPFFVEKTYYLAPDNSDRAYKLLSLALRAVNKVAVCKFYTRGKDHLVAIKAVGDVLMMYQLYYEAELRTIQIPVNKNAEPNEKEIQLAMILLGQLSKEKFDLSSYKDEYAERLRAAIETKQSGMVKVGQQSKQYSSSLEELLANSIDDLEKAINED